MEQENDCEGIVIFQTNSPPLQTSPNNRLHVHPRPSQHWQKGKLLCRSNPRRTRSLGHSGPQIGNSRPAISTDSGMRPRSRPSVRVPNPHLPHLWPRQAVYMDTCLCEEMVRGPSHEPDSSRLRCLVPPW